MSTLPRNWREQLILSNFQAKERTALPPMMDARLRSGLDLARQDFPKLRGLHFHAQAQVMLAQGHLGVAPGHRHRGHRSAQFHRATGGGLGLEAANKTGVDGGLEGTV